MKKLMAVLFLMVLIMAGTVLATNRPDPNFVPQWSVGNANEAALAEGSGPAQLLLVNREYPLSEDFSPTELVNLYDQKRSFKLAESDILVEKQVFEAMERMFKSAGKDGVKGFIITSGYRTWKKQQQLFKESAPGIAQAPGASEHQTGLAFDVTAYSDGGFETTDQFKWLSKNCWDFGFILRYPKGAEDITGIEYESWHYRYVGVEAAQSMRDSGETLEEYVGNH